MREFVGRTDAGSVGANRMTDNLQLVSNLPLWRGPVDPTPLAGGITNVNFVVEDADRKSVV